MHRHAHARRLIEQYLDADLAKDPARTADMLALQANLAVWSDRLDELSPRLDAALACTAALPAFRLGTLCNCAAYLLLLKDDYSGARQQFLKAKGILEQCGGRASHAYSDAGIATSDLLQGRFHAAAAWLERSRFALLAGDPAALPGISRSPPSCHSGIQVRIERVTRTTSKHPSMRVATKANGTLALELDTLLATAQSDGRVVRALHLKGLLAQALWIGGKQAEGIALLRAALRAAAPENMVQTFADEPWVLGELMTEIAADPADMPEAFIRTLLEACRVPEVPGTTSRGTLQPIPAS